MNIIKKKNILKHFKGISPRQLFIIAFFVITVLGASFFSVYSQSGGGLGGSSLSKGLIAHWTLDADDYNSTTFRVSDNTPYENHGTNSGATPTTDRHGKVGGAMSFNGTSNYVLINDVVTTNPSSFTIAAWIKKDGNGSTYECALHQSTDSSIGASSFWLGLDSADNFVATIGARTGVGGGWAAGALTEKPVVGEWNHLLATWDGSIVRVYLNGQFKKQYNLASYSNITNPVRLGASNNGTTYQFNGSIDDVRIYNRSFSDDEVALLYGSYEPKTQISSINSGLVGHWTLSEEDYNTSNNRVTDKTPYENHGTNFGAMPTTDRHDKTGGAMDFGLRTNNYYLNIGNDTSLQVTGDQTIAMWLKPVNVAEGRQNPYNKAYGGEGTITQETNGSFNYYWGTGGGNTTPYQGFGMASTIQNNIWSHIAIVRNLNTMKLRWYKNGIFVNETNASYSSATASAISASIGTGYAGAYSGSIDDVRLYNRALSDDEISLLYSSYTPQTGGDILQKGLVLDMPLTSEYTKTETAGSQIMTDRTPYGNDGQNYGATITAEGASFDGGTGKYIRRNIALNQSSWSVSSWLMKRSHTLSQYPIFWSFSLPYIACNGSGQPFRLSYSAPSQVHTYGTTIPELNKWYHVVATADSSGTKIYVNGILEGSNPLVATNAGGTFDIGRHLSNDTYRIDGGVRNLKIYNRAISEDEVKSLYTQGAAMIGGIPNQE